MDGVRFIFVEHGPEITRDVRLSPQISEVVALDFAMEPDEYWPQTVSACGQSRPNGVSHNTDMDYKYPLDTPRFRIALAIEAKRAVKEYQITRGSRMEPHENTAVSSTGILSVAAP